MNVLAGFTKSLYVPNSLSFVVYSRINYFIMLDSGTRNNDHPVQKREHSVSSSDEDVSSKASSLTLNKKIKTSKTNKKTVKKQKLLTSFATVSKVKSTNSETGSTDSNISETSKPFGISLPDTDRTTKDGKLWNFKISSWNIAGIRAWIKKNGLEYIKQENPDIITLQEVKCPENKLPLQVNLPGYHTYWIDSQKSGYAGVALYSKVKPISVIKGLGIKEHDVEGRVITAEYEKFYVVGVYVPNAGSQLKTLPKRLKWDEDFTEFLCSLQSKKPVILCGDLNVALERTDLARPDTNTKSAGFTIEERQGMTNLLSKGFIDTFRHIYPDVTGAYTFWAYFNNARGRNTGWRIDYFVISESLLPNVCDNTIRKDVLGSDHCPITLYLSF